MAQATKSDVPNMSAWDAACPLAEIHDNPTGKTHFADMSHNPLAPLRLSHQIQRALACPIPLSVTVRDEK